MVFFLSPSSLSSTTWCSRLILYIFCPSLRISQFSKGPWFLLLENSIKNQDLGARWAVYFDCYSIVIHSSQNNIWPLSTSLTLSLTILFSFTSYYIHWPLFAPSFPLSPFFLFFMPKLGFCLCLFSRISTKDSVLHPHCMWATSHSLGISKVSPPP